jgi:hypothetical protein
MKLVQMNPEFNWRVKQTLSHKFQRCEETGDLTKESFEVLMGYLCGVYCGHYNSLENVFKEREKYIKSLETQIAKSIDKVEE